MNMVNKPNPNTPLTPEEQQKEYEKEYEDLSKKGMDTFTDDERIRFIELKEILNPTQEKSVDELKKEYKEAFDKGEWLKAKEIAEKIKNLNSKPVITPQKDHLKEIEDIFNDKSTKNRSKEKKENIKKLLEEYQKQRESKNKSLEDEKNSRLEKPKNAVLNDLYSKLLENDDKMEMGGKIGKVNSSVLPFIPSLKDKTDKNLKKEGVISFNLGEIEFLTYSGWKRRNKINRVANELNKIDTDSEKAVRYLFSMSRKRSGGRPGALMKQAFRSRFDAKKMFNRNPEEFITKAKEQLDKFINEITDGHETAEVKEIQKGIKDRFDYHIRNYKATQAQKWMSN